jgi:phosphate transport system substrate-binding protein
MRSVNRLALVAAAASLSFGAAAADISGAGATFPYPIYAKWADAYKNLTGVGLN